MTDDLRTRLLRTDIGLLHCTPEQDEYLQTLLSSAASFLATRGLTPIAGDSDDDLLVASVAAWMYRTRIKGDQSGLPRFLDIQIKDRIMAARMRGAL